MSDGSIIDNQSLTHQQINQNKLLFEMDGRALKFVTTREKTCDLCKQTSGTEGNDIVFFGEWMTRSDVTVHYHCLLLATDLPQRGEDHNGILGFLLRDIRNEINSAKRRSCTYCDKTSASIKCCGCSKVYFHLICGYTNKCLFQFVGEFKSYCSNCLPQDEEQKRLAESKPDPINNKCYICMTSMGMYYPYSWIRAKCCKNGFVHSVCMQKYALTSGYYLKCIWCKDAIFREDVKYMGIFVPDRNAYWEGHNANRDLHRGHKRCDMEKCHCAHGRKYNKGAKWKIIICKLCGLTGAHNPTCIPGMENSKQRVEKFKCDTCSSIEYTIMEVGRKMDINVTLYVNKGINNISTDGSDSSISSVDTVINQHILDYCTSVIDLASAPDQLTQKLTQGNELVFAAGSLHIGHPCEIPSPSVCNNQAPYNNSQVMDRNQNLSNIELIDDQTCVSAADGVIIGKRVENCPTDVDDDDVIPNMDEINMSIDYMLKLVDI